MAFAVDAADAGRPKPGGQVNSAAADATKQQHARGGPKQHGWCVGVADQSTDTLRHASSRLGPRDFGAASGATAAESQALSRRHLVHRGGEKLLLSQAAAD